MSIGFALVTATLTINGTIKYGFNKDDYDIYFSKAIIDGKDKSREVIDEETRKKITYETSELKAIGDKSILDFEVTNNSRQYDATVEIECVPTNQEKFDEYVTIKSEMPVEIIRAQSRETGTITVELKKASVEAISEEFTCTITATATEREDNPEVLLSENSCENIPLPTLDEGKKLIPVTISDEGVITKVSKDNSDWYNYCEKRWANAIILNDGEDTPNDGEQIDMSEIESMFVWIPKYKYRLWNVETTNENVGLHTIDIEFDTEDTTEENGVSCETPKESGDIGNCSNGEYMTHPAFLAFGGNGFWVGKFETGYKGAQSKSDAEQDNAVSDHIIIKPNVVSWRSNTVKNVFEAAINYEPDLESHMMKNTEWGAVAYLSHSIFGINKEVTINNNSAYKTGYAALPDKIKENGDSGEYNTAWNTENGYRASTTGNITGIYDMSGGAFEYMAAYRLGTYGDSKFDETTLENKYNSKYYDSYNASSEETTYQYMILGDAIGEMGPFRGYINSWYGDYSRFVVSSYPWFVRGGYYKDGVLAGLFYSGRSFGGVYADGGSRLVLAPSN